ncbi:MAG: NAD kinase [Chitinophagales bacterium]|nr:NAD kinase [Chitinophagales bacterium]MDW8428609.1 NAD kinase [Chitinophagales bacterium]
MTVALYCRSIAEADLPVVQRMLELLQHRKFRIFLHKRFYECVSAAVTLPAGTQVFTTHAEISEHADYLFSLGGDGTLLDTLTLVRDRPIPVAGINLGRLGFLANIGKDEIEATIDALLEGTYVLDRRALLELVTNRPVFDGVNFALNDITLHKKDTSNMILIHTYLNGQFLNSYFADGLIVATPTGSTGYSLSCGGPIVMPDSGNIILTPIAPHNLNVRPMVLSEDSVLSFEVEGRSREFYCTLDSRTETLDASFQIAVKKCGFTMKLIRLRDHHFLDTLRRKLMWGADIRR